MVDEDDLTGRRRQIEDTARQKPQISPVEAEIKGHGHKQTHQCQTQGDQTASLVFGKAQLQQPLPLFFTFGSRRVLGRFDLLFGGLALAPQQFVAGDVENFSNHGNGRQVGCTVVPFPTANGFIGNIEPLGKLLLGHAVGLPQGSDQAADGLFFHGGSSSGLFSGLILPFCRREHHPTDPEITLEIREFQFSGHSLSRNSRSMACIFSVSTR